MRHRADVVGATQDVSELFGCFGAVETVIMQRPPETVIPFVSAPSDDPDARHAALGTQCAKVVYESEAALDAALATPVESTVQTYVAGSLPTGMRKWLGEWRARRPDVAKLQLQVERFMEGFDRKERAEREAAAASKATPVVDEEGFTLVTYGSSRKKRPRVFHEEGGPPRESAKEAKKRAQQEQMVLSFYKFQKRDAQQKQLDTLRRRVEEDKRRIARMKERREFNPFA
jgi:ribosomal RNA-processing protein 7